MFSRPFTRRAFVQAGSSLTASAAVFPALSGLSRAWRGSAAVTIRQGADVQVRSLATDPDADRIRALLLRAVDAAKSAGASYADARAVRLIDQAVQSRRQAVTDVNWHLVRFKNELPLVEETERHAISVRALVNGAWGFTASPWWTDDEAAALAHDAVAQARDNAQWITNKVELVHAPAVTGTWITPYRIDPFAVPLEEKMEVLRRAEDVYRPLYRPLDHTEVAGFLDLSCRHVTRVLATTEGTFISQQFYTTTLGRRWAQAQLNGVDVLGNHNSDHPGWRTDAGSSTGLQDAPIPPGIGWETITDADLWTVGKEAGDTLYTSLIKKDATRPKPLTVGRYTIVMDAATVGRLVDVSIGQATDLDRITGIEANTGGTSYLGTDPLQLLGQYSFGSPLLTVTTTHAESAGKVKNLPASQWDDEGVAHTPFTMVKEGILEGIPTTRDRASRLGAYDAKRGRPVASNGCAASGDGFGLELPTVNPPTLVMQPAAQDVSVSDMIASVPRGLMLNNGAVRTDFQGRQLLVTGQLHEIVNGRLGAPLSDPVVMIDTTQLWKSLTAIGGASTASAVRGEWTKGVPAETLQTSVVAVPGVFRDMVVGNGGRV